MDIDELQHVGVPGMKWGVRRNSSSGSSSGGHAGGHSADHVAVAAIRKKKLKHMTDSEIKIAAERMKLVKDYTSAGGRANKVKSMSNDELAKGTARQKLVQEAWTKGVKTKKRIKDMTDAEVKATLDRQVLEKSYKDLDKGNVSAGKKLVQALLVAGVMANQ